MPKAKKRKRSILAPILALLLVLALAGTLLFSAFRDKIEHWEYPQRFATDGSPGAAARPAPATRC